MQNAETTLADCYRQVARGHAAEADVHYTCQSFAGQCDAHLEWLALALTWYKRQHEAEPERLYVQGPTSVRKGPVGLLRDLQDLYQLANLVDITWTLIAQAGYGARDRALLDVVARCAPATEAQVAWLRMRMKAAAPQALLVAT